MPDWDEFVEITRDRPPREWLVKGISLGSPGLAVDLGCGAGNDALALLRAGFRVIALDLTPSAVRVTRERAVAAGVDDRLRCVVAPFTGARPPERSLEFVHAGFSLPFASPDEFSIVWSTMVRALAPGGIFVGQLFGDRDEWARPGADVARVFHRRGEVDRLVRGLDVVDLEEVERDGELADGTPKHWHVYHLVLRR